MIEKRLQILHNESFKNQEACQQATICGCFCCLAIFSPNEIKEWHEENRVGGGYTALCPKCGIDSVLSESENVKITMQLLQEMHEEFFLKKTLPGIQ